MKVLLEDGKGVVMDVKAVLPRNPPEDISLWRL